MKKSPASERRNAALIKARNNMIARAMRRLSNNNSMILAKNKNKLKKMFNPKKSPVKKSLMDRLFRK
jgi:cell division protein FtsB